MEEMFDACTKGLKLKVDSEVRARHQHQQLHQQARTAQQQQQQQQQQQLWQQHPENSSSSCRRELRSQFSVSSSVAACVHHLQQLMQLDQSSSETLGSAVRS
jgi:hypothetical protein